MFCWRVWMTQPRPEAVGQTGLEVAIVKIFKRKIHSQLNASSAKLLSSTPITTFLPPSAISSFYCCYWKITNATSDSAVAYVYSGSRVVTICFANQWMGLFCLLQELSLLLHETKMTEMWVLHIFFYKNSNKFITREVHISRNCFC